VFTKGRNCEGMFLLSEGLVGECVRDYCGKIREYVEGDS
jgi:hypothetical protein